MAEEKLKNQHTLYRFISLRNPELVDKKDIKNRFVFHPDNLTSIFFRRMASITQEETKWQNLQVTAASFVPFKNLEQMELLVNSVDQNFSELASWLSKKSYSTDSKEMLRTLENLTVLDLKIELQLWDNLFYQVVTEKDFYVKELIIEILILNNLLKQINLLETNDEKLSLIQTLSQATLVLPTELFEEKIVYSQEYSFKEEVNTTSKRTETASHAKENIKNLEVAQKEIIQIEKKYQKDAAKASNLAFSEFENLIKPLKQKYYSDLDIEKRRICEIPKPENYDPNDFCNRPFVKYPDLPKFDFEFPLKLDDETLQNQLSSKSYETLIQYKAIEEVDSYADIINNIQESIKSEYQIITENEIFSQSVMLIGGVEVTQKSEITANTKGDAINPAFVPQKFGVRNIGIADYKKVVAHVCCYDAGEVSNIENVMAKELRSKTTTRERIEEITETTETQQEKENLTDTSTTERFEMQTEVSKLLQEQKQFSASASFHAGWGSKAATGKYTLDLGANYATNTTKTESNRQAVTQAKDITNRAMERIVSKIRSETIKKTTDRFKEENVHAYDNRNGEHHVSGVYRFINAIYKNQIFNYGKRMMYEFMIPQPGKLHHFGMEQSQSSENLFLLQKPIDPRISYPDFRSINENNYLTLSSKYGAEINPYPKKVNKSISKVDDQWGDDGRWYRITALDVEIPEGYKIDQLVGDIKLDRHEDTAGNSGGVIQIGTQIHPLGNNAIYYANFSFSTIEICEKLRLTMYTWDMGRFGYDLIAICSINANSLEKWQLETFDAIIKGYEKQLENYNLQLETLKTKNSEAIDSNPRFYRDIEQLVLRKNCISYLMNESLMGQSFYNGSNLETYNIDQSLQMDNYASLSKFMEQAFEWELISYNFYPFYWGNRKDWKELYQYDCNDPLFRSFMQAGMARVILTVKPGYEKAVMHYMTTKQIWNGGQVPVIGDNLYMSIVEELKEQEYTIEDTWETIVPTSLVALQSSGVAIKGEGLPCGSDCIDHTGNELINNNQTLGIKVG